MKRLLILSYYFPPLGMGGTQRVAGFVRYLPDLGWLPTVITVKPVRYFASDSSLLSWVRAARVERTESLDPLRVAAWFGRHRNAGIEGMPQAAASGGWQRWMMQALYAVLLPDTRVLWLPFAYRRAMRLLREGEFDAIFSSGPPHSVHLLAAHLARRFEIPWVADFRDGWAGGDFQPEPAPWNSRINRSMQRFVLQRADAVVAVSTGLADILRHEVDVPGKVNVITNGYEPEDFRGAVNRDRRFDIVHVGTVGNYVLPDDFLVAFYNFVQLASLTPEQVRLHFIGADLTGRLARQVAALHLSEYVAVTGYVPHQRAVAELRQADLLLFLVGAGPHAGFIPGKTFEYLAAGRPILAVCPDIEGLTILRPHALVRHVQPGRVDEMVLALKAFWLEHEKDMLATQLADREISQYSRKALTKQLVHLLNHLTEDVAEKKAPFGAG